jgi:twinkle protein
MVSLPHGASSAKKDIQKQIPLFQGYDEVVLFLDSDDAGRQATDEAASVLPPGKTKIARLEKYKDASDALQANDSQAIREAIWNATPYRPDGIVDGKSLLSVVTTPQKPYDHEYPFQGLNEKLHGIRYGELTTFCAGSGSGKTSIIRHIATDLLIKGESVGILELEASNRRTALGLMSTAVGKNLHLGEHDRTELESAFGDSIANWNLFCFDGFGSYDPDVIYNRIEYLATGLDCKVVFLDHLSILLSGLEGDERRMIDTTMTRLRSLVERTGIALFLVSHLRRASNDKHSHEEGGRVSLSSLRGSHSIAQISDSVIALERDQQADTPGNPTIVRVLKNRYSGEVGVACTLTYDLNTCRFTEHETEPEFNPTTDF